MKKIGIITICDYINYGNRLQNYALHEFMASMGYEPTTVVNLPAPPDPKAFPGLAARIKNALRTSPFVLVKKIHRKVSERIDRPALQRLMKAKEASFLAFTKEHISETPYVVNPLDVPAGISDEFDYFVVGSDQVWNPNFRHGSPFDFLQFSQKEKRIAFAPSFGITVIPDRYVDSYRALLMDMAHLSVREDAGAAIIQELTGREATVLVDPTLLLTRQEWLKMARPARQKPEGRYLVTYFLGELSPKRDKLIRRIATVHGLEVVRLSSLKDPGRYATDPAEFVDYIHSADIILTDSFHGTVFSILFEKPFIVFNREGRSAMMGSRMDTLLAKFSLGSRAFSRIDDKANLFTIDYGHVPPILDAERKRAKDYLSRAMGPESESIV